MERQVIEPPFTFSETRVGSGSPVVLLHGLSGSRQWWGRNMEALSSHHLVSAIDLVGFGRSRPILGPKEPPPGFLDMAAALARWISRSFDSQRVHLVGHSMGGHVALHLAANHPELIRSLVLVSSTGTPFAIDPLAHVRNLYPLPPGFLAFSRVLAADLLRAGAASIALSTLRILRDDAREVMRSVRVPTLLVWGERDPLVPERYAEQLRKEIEHADLTVIPHSGHVAMWENAERFNEVLLEFFAAVDAKPAVAVQPVAGDPWAIQGVEEGMAWRSIGAEPQVVMLHGLAIGSAYFGPLANELYRRGVSSIAPDLPGLAFSRELEADPEHDAEAVVAWARGRGIGPAVWLGQSTGCQTLERVAQIAPELVRRAIFVSPVWSRHRHLGLRTATRLPADALIEPFELVLIALGAFWRAGLLRMGKVARYYTSDARRERRLPAGSLVVTGEDDRLADWETLRRLRPEWLAMIPGAHGAHFSHPEELAEVVLANVGFGGRDEGRGTKVPR
jgi:pimeloyl-ACP methyl ester carboxylesterase